MPVVVRSWEYIHRRPCRRGGRRDDEATAAEKLDPEILKGQIVEYETFFTTDATKGKRYGWQAEEDWKGTIAVLEKTKSIPAGTKTSDYYTNKFVPG